MKKALVIATKELCSYFKSPIAYVVLIVTISVFNVFFYMIIDQGREATLRDMFQLMEFMFVFIIPLLTMGLLSQEKRSGTIEFLLTCPIRRSSIVLGKYLGSIFFFTILILLTSIYYIIIEFFAQPDRIEMILGYTGILAEGALFIAIGLFTSSLTKNQVIAAISSYIIIFLLYFSLSFMKYINGPFKDVVHYIGVWSHVKTLSAGLLQLSDLVYFISGILFFLFLTTVILKAQHD